MPCYTPYGVKSKVTGETIPVPCGRCPYCVKKRALEWSFRLMQEEKRSSSALFVTLTYDTKHAPMTKNGFMSLNIVDVQLFMKRLRKAHGGNVKLKYYCAGEYGGKTLRPHYHLILFNAKVELIQKAWGLGKVHYGTVTGASVGYTLKYMMKKGKIPMHKNDDRQIERALMSKDLACLI